MAAITIDSPRWRDGWGEPLCAPAPPALRVVSGGRTRRPNPALARRRRFAAAAAVGLLLAAALAVGSVVLSRPVSAGTPAVGRQLHVVAPGDTYWSIAESVHERGDLRVTVDALIDANGGRPLFPGDRIELP